MRKVGFIDLTSKDSGDIYVFSGSGRKYEFGKVIGFKGSGASPQADLAGINDFVLSLPLELLNFRILKLPFNDREKLVKVIPFELENLILEGSESVVFDATVLGSTGDSFDVLVTYIRREVLKEILADLTSQGMDPETVTSLELRELLKGGIEEIAPRLVIPGKLDPEERVRAAGDELLNLTINLRTGPFAYTRDLERGRRSMKVTVALLIVLSVAINAYFAFEVIMLKGEASSLRREMRNAYGTLFPNEKKISDELYQLKSHIKEAKEKGDALIGVNPLQFLLHLSQKSQQGVSFSEVLLDRDLIIMKGEASSMGDIDKAKVGLSEFLRDVSVSDIKPSTGGKTFFTLVAKGTK